MLFVNTDDVAYLVDAADAAVSWSDQQTNENMKIVYNKYSGVYGDVQRVKILYNKKDSALIQMAEPHQAYLGEFF